MYSVWLMSDWSGDGGGSRMPKLPVFGRRGPPGVNLLGIILILMVLLTFCGG